MDSGIPFSIPADQLIDPELPSRPSFAARIQRAHDLCERYPNAVEILRYYERLAFHQQHIFDSLSVATAPEIATDWTLHTGVLLPLLRPFARALADVAPPAMRDTAAALAGADAAEQSELLASFWNGSLTPDAPSYYVALAFLQPYAEWLSQHATKPAAVANHATCPICASEPVCAVLRDQHHGARRSLVCSLCMNEWAFLRVACPDCGEERFESLPVFTAAELPQVRVDACDTCKHYLKTVDMTKDGLAVPIVDELAAISLDLWASERGYIKLSPNLAGL